MTYNFDANTLLVSYGEYSYISTLVHMSLSIHQYDNLVSRCRYHRDKVLVPREVLEVLHDNWRMLKLADCAMLTRDVHLMRNIAKTLRIK